MITIGQTLSRYRIVEKIGSGGMGDVYLARDERLERSVAVKVLSAAIKGDEISRKRFRREALTLSRLNHPNIATILDYDSQGDIDFLVMEYIVGSMLGTKLEEGPIPEKQLVPLAIQIGLALEEAHSRGVVHRDLKPNNVILTERGQIKVLDFGLAKLVQQPTYDAATLSAVHETNLIIGTLAYMSPEQLRSEAVDARSDIYSFGVMLYELSTGKRPHAELNPISLADAVLHRPPTPPGQLRSDLSSLFQHVILKCLEKDPGKRYQSVKEMLIDLDRLQPASTPLSTLLTQERLRPERRKGKLGRIALYAGSILISLAVLFAGFVMFQKQKSLPSKVDPGIQINSVVALPSKVYGSDENDFLSDAVPNALSAYLSRLESMETRVPPTSIEVERLGGDLKKIGQVFDVNALVSSSVTADKDQLILNVQLLEPESQKVLWSENYDGQRENYLQLVRTAADGLRGVLRPQAAPVQPAAPARRTTDAEFAYQRGSYYLHVYRNLKKGEDFERALADLQHALELDPTNALAAASIARLYVARLESGAPLGEALPEMDRWAYRALELDNRCGEAWQVLTLAEEMRPGGDPHKRLEYALRAASFAKQSGYSHQLLGVALSKNSFALGVAAAQEAVHREPLHLNGLLFTAGLLSRENRPGEALDLIDKALSIESGMPVAVMMKVWLLLRDHRVEEAEKWAEPLDQMVAERRLHPGWVDFAREWMDFEESVREKDAQRKAVALERLVRQARGQAPPFIRWEIITGNVLGIQAQHDTIDATLETLSVRIGKGILEPYDWLLSSSELSRVRNDSRFQKLLPRSKTEFQEMLAVLEEARKRGELPSYLEKPLANARNLP